MRYHFVVNGYADDVCRQMEEQAGFAEQYLSGFKQGEAIIYCREEEDIRKLEVHHAKEAVLIRAPQYVPEMVLDVLCGQADAKELYIFGNDDSSIELAVRMAARLSGSSVAEAEKLYPAEEEEPHPTAEEEVSYPAAEEEVSYQQAGEEEPYPAADTEKEHEKDLQISVEKMVYANHMKGTFAMEKGPYCISLARGGERRELEAGAFVIKEEMICRTGAEHIVSQEFYPEESEAGLENARIILAAGRGIRNKENMAVIDEAARCLGAEVAVSRPAAMNAWKPMNRLVGVSGAMVSPDICITAGISGAAALYAGIEKSGFIVAVNTDEKAPIMKMADVAVVEDFLPVMKELIAICQEESR